MATQNAANQDYVNNADGWQLGGGVTKRTLTLTSGNVAISGGSSTLTLAGNLTTAGTSAVTLTSSATTNVTLPTSGTLSTISGTETLTNKRITKRVGTTTSSATPSINTDLYDMYTITALAVNITSVTVSGTPTNGQTLWIAITDNGTARSIAWGSSFESSTVGLPITTVISARLDIGFVWNTVTSKWRCVAVA